MELLGQYERVTQKVLLFIELVLRNAKRLNMRSFILLFPLKNYRPRKPRQ
jgi:hypothetical protein